MADWKDEVSRLDIVQVAQKLGLQVAPGRRSPRLALCPFHDDDTPSLHLYQTSDPHYHCFACHAHGDTVELVKQRERVDFVDALRWLSANFGITAASGDLRSSSARRDILGQAFGFWQKATDSNTIKSFAEARQFHTEVLQSAGITVGSVEAFLTSLESDRSAQDAAIAAGLAFATDEAVPVGLRSNTLSPFARGNQVLIPLANERGRVIGVMARALAGKGPKYRFTAGFSKSEVLYRSDVVHRQIESKTVNAALDGAEDCFDLCVCEGVFDALRLETAGIPAVAVLGSSLSDAQVRIIVHLAELTLGTGKILRVHLFFDADKGGRSALADSIPRLLKTGAESDFLVDIVGLDRPPEEKADPDVIISTLSAQDAVTLVAEALISPIDALAAISLDKPFSETATTIERLDAAGSIMLQNRLARRLQKLDWPKVWKKLRPDRTTLSSEPVSQSSALSEAYGRLATELLQQNSNDVARTLPEPFSAEEGGSEAILLHALILAREATDSREYPVDVAAWDRIEEGAQVFLPIIEEELAHPKPPRRPYLAHFEAKDSGAPRLKCGPCPEEAIQQQYILSELLRVRPERRDVGELIPAVRYWSDHPGLVVTGTNAPKSAVSFAYQIDMRALEERPDRMRRRDMFRPFLDCWNSFILHIGSRVDRMRCDLLYIARLDVKGFYDNIPRHAVEKVLNSSIPELETLDTLNIAELFGKKHIENRRQALLDWILSHSFGTVADGYTYSHPGSGLDSRKGGAKGLPQGPLLSSYLANIVLFDLDAELERRVELLDAEAATDYRGRSCGGLYARYVDDIVIAAGSPEELRALRSAIEAKLEPLGLELNEKSEHLEPMTAEEARNWVVERRGAGFVAYGEIDDQPSPAPDIRTGWSDIPTLDRRTALNLLYWSALDDPQQTTRSEFEETLATVSRAEGLRSTDLIHIARRAILRAALDAQGGSPDERCSHFQRQITDLITLVATSLGNPKLRVKTRDMPVASALAAARYYSATLAGIERLILGNPEANPTFSPKIQVAIANAKSELLDWILNRNILGELQNLLIPDDSRGIVQEHLSSQLEIFRATLEERAARARRLNTQTNDFIIERRPVADAPAAYSAYSVRIGWFRTFSPDGLANIGGNDPILLFHAIAAEIQAAGGRIGQLEAGEELTTIALSNAMKSAAEQALQDLQGGPGVDRLRDIALAFRAMAGVADPLPPDLRMRAISAFLSLSAGPYQANALIARPALLDGMVYGATIIPLPPIPGQPGLFCYNAADRVVRAIIISDVEEPARFLPPDLAWARDGTATGHASWTAPLPDGFGFLLNPAGKKRAIDDDLDTIADVFEGLLERHGIRSGTSSTLVHVFALIGPLTHRMQDDVGRRYFSLSWSLPRGASERLVFERRGDGIANQRSPHAGAELWRIGQSVADLFSISSDAAEDGTPLRLSHGLLQDRLKRMAFSRLRGRWINGAQVAAALATQEIPKALTRIIKALRETAGSNESVGPLALEFFLSGRAMRTRIRLGVSVDVPGGWARYLEMIGARSLTPGDDEHLFSQAAPRNRLPRPARALARVADSLVGWASRTDAPRCREILQATATGFEINGLRIELRDFVLACIARFGAVDLARLAGVRPLLGSLGGYGQIILIEPRFAGEELTSSNYDLERQGRELFFTLSHATTLRALSGRAALDRITTAGWLIVLSVMCGALNFDMEAGEGSDTLSRPSFMPLGDVEIALPLRALAVTLIDLALSTDQTDAEAWPWEISGTLNNAGLRAAVDGARGSLAKIGAAMGLVMMTAPEALRMLSLSDQEAEFITAEGETYRLPWWRCTLLTTSAERADRTETYSVGDRLVHPYSSIHDTSGRILTIQVLSESLATVAGFRQAVSESEFEPAMSDVVPTESEQTQAAVAEVLPPVQSAQLPDVPLPEVAAHPVELEAPADLADETHPEADAPPVTAAPISEKKRLKAGRPAWRERQHGSWKARASNAGLDGSRYGRIAILQYDFVDSYYSEAFPKYDLGSGPEASRRVEAGAVQCALSFEEHRRRRVLTHILACCDSFGVEALVLPEYSVWPETINWIEEFCRQQEYKISVWAGTFRQSAGFELALTSSRGQYLPVSLKDTRAVIRPMEAILTVIFRETQSGKPLHVSQPGKVADENSIFNLTLPETLSYRPKKYPSIGMYEEFKPSTDLLKPLMSSSRSINRVESYITELVCSELFVFNGPLNWVNFADHLADSASRYRLDKTDWLDLMIDDARHAAKVFGGEPGHKPRRSILLLPCATSRDADYHYFAQGAYLASGIVTAFCNSSQAPALGGSCFVGPGGWESRGAARMPGPYHGALPGFLTINNPDRGALGSRENALIIADIRPDRTVEDRPRSQTLGAPMRLVAHIPIIEDRTCSPVKGQWNAAWWQNRKAALLPADQAQASLADPRMHDLIVHQIRDCAGIDLDDFADELSDGLDRLKAAGTTLNLSSDDRDAVIAMALALASLFETSPGMRHRASAMTAGLLEHPEALPCPALLDWLIVDLDVETFEVRLKELQAQPQGVMFSELPPALRDAAWRWLAPS